jgi:hypothetical protein
MAETLTYANAYGAIRASIGGEARVMPMKEIVDQAGSYLTGMHTWAWMKNRTALLDVRANVTGETATWTEAT